MPRQHLRILLYLVYTALALAALALLLPSLLPFLLALALALVLERPVRFLSDRTPLSRGWASVLVLVLFTLLLSACCALLLRRLWYELSLLSQRLPELLQAVYNLRDWLEQLLYRLTVAATPTARQTLTTALDSALSQLQELFTTLSGNLLAWMAEIFSALPTVVLFLITTLLACYFLLAGRPVLFARFRRTLPAGWLPRLEHTVFRLKAAWGGWLRAQGILMLLTFFLLAGGFLLMGVDAALLLAAGIALLDALPVFGTGTVLFPWAAFQALNGELRRCAALLVLYAVIWLTRSLLEPKLVADRAGLHPLVSLFAMYMGFSLFGVVGMLLAPLAAVALRQFFPGQNT